MNIARLSDLIQTSGLKKTAIANAMGISDSSLRNKLAGRTDFQLKEIQALASFLHMSPRQCSDIFFADEVPEIDTFRRDA